MNIHAVCWYDNGIHDENFLRALKFQLYADVVSINSRVSSLIHVCATHLGRIDWFLFVYFFFLPLKAEFLLKAWESLLNMARRSVVGDIGLTRFAFAALFTRFNLSAFFFGSWGMF